MIPIKDSEHRFWNSVNLFTARDQQVILNEDLAGYFLKWKGGCDKYLRSK